MTVGVKFGHKGTRLVASPQGGASGRSFANLCDSQEAPCRGWAWNWASNVSEKRKNLLSWRWERRSRRTLSRYVAGLLYVFEFIFAGYFQTLLQQNAGLGSLLAISASIVCGSEMTLQVAELKKKKNYVFPPPTIKIPL